MYGGISLPRCASCFSIKYVNMQVIYVDVQGRYVNMQQNYVEMQENCTQMRIIKSPKKSQIPPTRGIQDARCYLLILKYNLFMLTCYEYHYLSSAMYNCVVQCIKDGCTQRRVLSPVDFILNLISLL